MSILKDKSKIKIPRRRMQRTKWGVAGCGNYLEKYFLPALNSVQRNDLVSVYSKSILRSETIRKKFNAEHSYDNYDKFLDSDINAVYISSINADHFEQVIRAAKAKKNILCEKPLALTSEQAEEMINVCRENEVFLAVNYVYRFHPLVEKAKELIGANKLGKIVSISANFNINFVPDSNYRFKKELSGGGPLWDLGTHVIDLLRYFGGEISDIKGYSDNIIFQSEVEDIALGMLKFENGGFGTFNVSYNNKKAFNRIEINGYKGSIAITDLFGTNIHTKLIIDVDGEPKIAFRKRVNNQVLLLRSLHKAFIKKHPILVTGEDGLISIKILEKFSNSINS